MSQEIQVNAGTDQPLPTDAVQGVTETGSACPTHGVCWVRRTVRAVTALLVLGSAAAYGAVSIHPELANYAWFIPESGNSASHCSASAGGCSSGCPLEAAKAMLTSGEVEPGCCSMSKAGGCPLSQPAEESSEVLASAGVEEAHQEADPEAAVETPAAEATPVDVQPKTDLPGAEAEETTATQTTEEKPEAEAPVTE